MKELSDDQAKEIDAFCGDVATAISKNFPRDVHSNVMRNIFERVRLKMEEACKETEILFDENKKALNQIDNLFKSADR